MAISAVCILCQIGYLLLFVCLKAAVPQTIIDILDLALVMFWISTLDYIRKTPYYKSHFNKAVRLIIIWGVTAVAIIVQLIGDRFYGYTHQPIWIQFLPQIILLSPALFFSLWILHKTK